MACNGETWRNNWLLLDYHCMNLDPHIQAMLVLTVHTPLERILMVKQINPKLNNTITPTV